MILSKVPIFIVYFRVLKNFEKLKYNKFIENLQNFKNILKIARKFSKFLEIFSE